MRNREISPRETTETLLIRLLSRGKTFSDAIKDLLAVRDTVPELAPIAAEAMRVVVAFKKELQEDQLEEDEMEALRDIDAVYAEWEREVEAKAEAKASLRTARSFLLSVCEQLKIELTDEQRAEMATWDEEQLREAMAQMIATRRWPAS